MLALTRRPGETITLSPSKDVGPDMTVRELLVGGPITIEAVESESQTKLRVGVPHDLKLMRPELSSKHN